MTIPDTLKDRDGRYGDFSAQASFAQRLKAFLRSAPNWTPAGQMGLTFVQREALDLIATKISRILHGDPSYADSWHDIAGYAELGNGWKPTDRITDRALTP